MMRVKPEKLLIAAMAPFALTGVTAVVVQRIAEMRHVVTLDPILVDPYVDPPLVGPLPTPGLIDPVAPVSATTWFGEVRAHCNPVEVETRLRWQPAPDGEDGLMYEAACYALAGRIDRARAAIERLPEERRFQAAGVVFDVGHPAADAGDELAAGPLMELVVEYWPNHYMALYHAGAARYERGDHEEAYGYLERFLENYVVDDGWTDSARRMLEAMHGC